MSETSSQKPSATGMTQGIAADRLKKGVVVASHHSTTASGERVSSDIVVRIPRTETKVSVKLNTKLMAEQREIERANKMNRRSGR